MRANTMSGSIKISLKELNMLQQEHIINLIQKLSLDDNEDHIDLHIEDELLIVKYRNAISNASLIQAIIVQLVETYRDNIVYISLRFKSSFEQEDYHEELEFFFFNYDTPHGYNGIHEGNYAIHDIMNNNEEKKLYITTTSTQVFKEYI